MEGMFAEPDWSQPIDFSERVAAVPASAMVRGMFMQFLLAAAPSKVAERYAGRRYVAFKSYPMREYVEILAHACQASPAVAPAECVRRLGWTVYPNYANTITGTAIFAVAGKSFARVVELASTAYRITLPPARVHIMAMEKRHAVVQLREVWNLPEFHHVGIWEGAMRVCDTEGSIKLGEVAPGMADFDVHWR
jgi:uncharacterized protein (TIGR02265 family)